MAEKVLEGYRVIEYTQNLSGMHTGLMLAMMGAEVIKVEIPDDPDDLTRREAPIVNGVSAAFASVNMNKKSVALDFRTPEGAELLKKLLLNADAFIVTKRMKDMESLGFDYETVHKLNPKLVYGSVTCFGQTGSLSGLKGGDLIAQAAASNMDITGHPDGEPTKAGYPVSEMHAGINLCTGILGSWYKIRKGGEGQLVDVSMVDTTIAEMRINTGMYVYNGLLPKRGGQTVGSGKGLPATYPSCRATFKTADGNIVYSANSPKLFACALKAMNMEDLLERPEFIADREAMGLHPAINKWVQEWCKDHGTLEIFVAVSEAGAPAAPILTYKGMLAEENFRPENRNMFLKVDHPVLGEMTVTNLPVKWSRCQPTVETAAPLFGQNTEEVLNNL